jgi:Ca2+-binding EF-hand superfamily protein
MQGLMRSHGRLADRLLHEFDINHDGKVSHDEMNRLSGRASRRPPATHRR